MLTPGRRHLNDGLDAAVRDAVVITSPAWLSIATGFLVGLLTLLPLPALLFYHACILEPSAALGHLPPESPYPACAGNLANGQRLVLLVWPFLFGLLGAVYGSIRQTSLLQDIKPRWLPGRVRLYHLLALVAGYLALACTALVSGTWLLFTGTPLLAALSGPAMTGAWQWWHDRLLLYINRPTWHHLVAATAQIWLARRLAVPRGAILRAQAHDNGLLRLCADLDPNQVEEVRTLCTCLPGISKVEVCDATGANIPPPNYHRRLNAAVEAARVVALLRRARAQMYATGAYENRRECIKDISGRLLVATAIVVSMLIAATLTWTALKGGFRRITPEDLQWFFGKYGATSGAARTMPKSLQPRP